MDPTREETRKRKEGKYLMKIMDIFGAPSRMSPRHLQKNNKKKNIEDLWGEGGGMTY